ncbi:hypothetical protein CBS101457_005615 [Exobasidium rhododendri]|nr:hypothetical protein CBS101457_005615 [Exobasidium rhododendri]
MASEGLGLTFNKYGFWKSNKTVWKNKERRHTHSQEPPAFNLKIEPIQESKEPHESEGERRMRETRHEMGLPEGLDLSLDLGPAKGKKEDDRNTIKALREESNIAIESDEDQTLITIPGKGGEADVLDVLRLVWLPPSMRTVKEPNRSGG